LRERTVVTIIDLRSCGLMVDQARFEHPGATQREYYRSSTLGSMPYEWEEWALRALLGIEPYEVRQALEHKGRWPRPGTDPSTGLRLLTIWGRTLVGRPLVVAIYHVEGFTWKIVGAREMTTDELAEFTRWEETQ
jgi:hypothetical protein